MPPCNHDTLLFGGHDVCDRSFQETSGPRLEPAASGSDGHDYHGGLVSAMPPRDFKSPEVFPAPLVLPWWDIERPPCPYKTGETLREFTGRNNQKPVTLDKRTIYVVPPPM